MKINNALKRLIEEALSEAKAASTEYVVVRCLFRHALCRKTRLSKGQATWVWHNIVYVDPKHVCGREQRGEISRSDQCGFRCISPLGNCPDFKLSL
jgi:hypothetical protein